MTLEEAVEALQKAQASITKLEEKNKELQSEKQVAKAKADEAEAAREEAAERAEREAKDVEALEKRLTAKFQKDIDNLTRERDEAIGKLRTTLVDNEIARAIRDNNVRDGMDEPLIALFQSKVKFENGEATIDGKAIGEFATEYLGSEKGSYFRRPTDVSGADATGSTTKAPASHGFTKENFKSREGEWMILAGSDPVAAKQAALDAGRPDLAADL